MGAKQSSKKEEEEEAPRRRWVVKCVEKEPLPPRKAFFSRREDAEAYAISMNFRSVRERVMASTFRDNYPMEFMAVWHTRYMERVFEDRPSFFRDRDAFRDSIAAWEDRQRAKLTGPDLLARLVRVAIHFGCPEWFDFPSLEEPA